jgi:glycosyltransferase involved in cell wall biosynthesis
MPELSVLIPGRNEEWLARTCADVLEHSDLDTEVIAVIDGEHKGEYPLPHPRLRVITLEASTGQRAATNLAAREASGHYVMKLDAHCSLAQGFDRAIVSALDGHPDWTLIPLQRNLHVFDWICDGCGHRTYMGPSLEQCERCKGTSHHREVVWRPRSALAPTSGASTTSCTSSTRATGRAGARRRARSPIRSPAWARVSP